MICAEAKELLESYVKGSTDAAAREALEAHFATCEGCRLEAELTRSIHGQSDSTEGGSLTLEPLTTEPVSNPSAPTSDADEEISFGDLVLEVPEATSAAAPVVARPATPVATPPAAHLVTPPAAHLVTPPPGAKPSAPVWDFEPVDPPRESGPPAESLNLAEQALTRKAEAKAKGKVAAVRVALWAAGGISGVALLGVSIWIALAFNQPATDGSGPGMTRPGDAPRGSSAEPGVGGVPPVDGSADSASFGPGPEGVPGNGSGEPPPAPSAIPDGSVQNQDGGAEKAVPSDGRLLRAGSLPAASGGPSEAIVAAPQKASKPSSGGSASRSPSTGAKSTTATTAPARTSPPRPVAGSSVSGSEAPAARTSSTGSRKPLGPQAPVDDLEPVTDEAEIPFTTVPRREAKPVPSSTGSTQAGGSAKPAPSTSGSTMTPSAGSEAGAAPDRSPAPAPSKPIDRLHEATVQAAAAEDVEALRKLKISWKNMIRTATASERARSKREYADCLWAIQELSGRTPDRREALAAYREYVLYAPAGANDARTVGRMRFLEDVLAESE